MKRALLLLVLAAPLASAWAQDHREPITTGTSQTRMDAPEKNSELESYTHSAMVRKLAGSMGISTGRTARYFEDFNSGVLLLAVFYLVLKLVPGRLRAKRAGVDRELREARAATAESQRRLGRAQEQLAGLPGEVEALRRQAKEGAEAERVRLQAALEEEKGRIARQAEIEVAASEAGAQRGLRRFVAELAVERAADRVQLSPEDDRAMVDGFLRELAGQMGREGRN